jgi:hypothetical protein
MEPRPILWDLRQTQLRPEGEPEGPSALPALDALEPRDVFRLLCAARAEHAEELMPLFEQLLSEVSE